jgi:hypothetical protein
VSPPLAATTPAPPVQGPAILGVTVTPAVAHEGDTISWDVLTTQDVSGVQVRVKVAVLNMVQIAPGHFSLAFQIPRSLPPFFHGTYAVEVVARTGAGAQTTRTVTMALQ